MPALSPSHRLDALCRAHQLDFRPAEADQPAYLFYHRTPPSSVLREVRLLAGAFELSRVAEPALDLPLRVPDRVDVAPEADPFLTTGSAQQLADAWIRQAIAQGASDLHIEPFEHTLRVRFRLDGVLREAGQINGIQASAVASRLKVMADLDIAERRRPQDGRIRFNDAGTAIDLRVSTLPTCFGEKIVLRVLDASSVPLTLEGVGLNGAALDDVRTTVRRPHGLVLVTGPTGSGKSTTLYAALNERNTPDVNIVTAEDPIEYRMAGLNQTAIRPDLGFGFAEALRSFLRQDPDVVMVGEIRDTETARVAVRAALTGHLVLSTLHTNDAARTIGRLIDMQVEPYLLASSLKLVLAQRLVRRLCSACKQPESPEAPVRQEFGVARDQPTYSAVGCPACAGTGYRGRLALFERLVIGETLSQAIASRESPAALCRRAAQAGYPSLRDEALQAVYAGDTSLAELLRVVV